jgi:GLPGLI family protein
MKKILVLFSLFATTLVKSQTIHIEYQQLCNEREYKCDLVATDTASSWIEKEMGLSQPSPKTTFVYKQRNHSKNYSNPNIFTKTFYLADSLCHFDWTLTNDTLTILNQKCLSASTTFRGRNYVAYYSPTLPYNEGPWKFCGLPGVILRLSSTDNFLKIAATKIATNTNDIIDEKQYLNNKFIDWETYKTTFIDTSKKTYKRVLSQMKKDDDGTSYKFKILITEIIYPEAQTGEGLTE